MAGNKRQTPDRRAADLEYRLAGDTSNTTGASRSGQDPFGTGPGGRSALGSQLSAPFLVLGRVVDVVAYVHSYKVQLAGGLGIMQCSDPSYGATGLLGSRTIQFFPPGTPVLVCVNPLATYGLIVCAVPDWQLDGSSPLPDMISTGSAVGIQRDKVHQLPFQTVGGGGIADFSANRPRDSLTVGEWGVMAHSGVGVFVDHEMAYLRVDEETGLFLFYGDQYARLSGHNLEIRSAGYEREDLDDEGEFSVVEGWAPLLWEAYGAYRFDSTVSRELTREESQLDAPWLGRLEPFVDYQLGLYRRRSYGGYLGQGGVRSVAIPIGNNDPEQSNHEFNDVRELMGVFEEIIGIDGLYGLRSARAIFHVKTGLIPHARRRRRPESVLGDNAKDAYRPNGVAGNPELPPHRVRPLHDATVPEDEEPPPTQNKARLELAALMDEVSLAFNWQGSHPFYYHDKDWHLPDESALDAYEIWADLLTPFADLATDNYLGSSTPYETEVDGRYGMIQYFANTSIIAQLPRGGVAIRDGFGAELRMSNGHIDLHSPADLNISSGRNVQVWASFDFNLKARRDFEVVASNGNGRIKAENNLLMLGGNNGCGGVLLESRGNVITADGTHFTGVVIRARNSAVAVMAAEVLVKQNPWSSGYGSSSSSAGSGGSGSVGNIVIDAGDGNLILGGNHIRRHVGEAAIDFLPNGVVNEFTADGSRFGGDLIVAGNSFMVGCVTTASDVVTTGQVAAGAYANLPGAAATQVNATATEIDARSLAAFRITSESEMNWLTANSQIANLQFRFRDTATYLPFENWMVYEPSWQQEARLSGQSDALMSWVEPILTDDFGVTSMPFPGVAAWLDDANLAQHDLTLYDYAARASRDRGTAGVDNPYEDPVYGETVYVPLDGHWLVIPIEIEV